MKISFSYDNQLQSFELSFETYQELKEAIYTKSEDDAFEYCRRYIADVALCRDYVSYESRNKRSLENLPKEFDTTCDYDDHL